MFSCIEHFVGLVGSILSIATFFLALRFRAKVMSLRETDDFHKNRDSIVSQVKGFQSSISKDGLKDETIRNTMYIFFLNLYSRYKNLGFSTLCLIKQITKDLDHSDPDWNRILRKLVKLIPLLEREI